MTATHPGQEDGQASGAHDLASRNHKILCDDGKLPAISVVSSYQDWRGH